MVTFHESPWMRRSQELVKQMMRRVEEAWPEVKDDHNLRRPIAFALLDLAQNQAYTELLQRRVQKLSEAVEELTINHTVSNVTTVSVGDVFNVLNISASPKIKSRQISAATALAILTLFLQAYATFHGPQDTQKPVATQTATPVAEETPAPG